MIGSLIRRGELAQRHTERRRPCEDRGRNYAAISRGMPRIDGNHQKLEEKEGSSPRGFGGGVALLTP